MNSLTKKDSYPIPQIDDSLKRLGGSKYFSAMDLASGYWQVELSPEDREKCALITSEGLYEPTRMPQGLCNAPATFQRSMDQLLGDLKLSSVLIYLDDITVFSRTFDLHLDHLKEVFLRLCAANLKLKKEKCSFLQSQLEFLGHTISSQGIMPQSSKCKSINNMPIPTSLRDIQAFLGMTGYYRQFVPSYAHYSEPLVQLLRKEEEFRWGKEQQASFDFLKKALVSPPLLVFPDFGRLFSLHCDASNLAAGVILVQTDTKGANHPIAYYSKLFNSAEQNYSVTERECLAVIWGVKHFRPFLYGTHFTIVTDHSSLRWLQNIKDPEGQLARWALKLQHYDFNIVHRPGLLHQNADGLSCLPIFHLSTPEQDYLYDLLDTPNLWITLSESNQIFHKENGQKLEKIL